MWSSPAQLQHPRAILPFSYCVSIMQMYFANVDGQFEKPQVAPSKYHSERSRQLGHRQAFVMFSTRTHVSMLRRRTRTVRESRDPRQRGSSRGSHHDLQGIHHLLVRIDWKRCWGPCPTRWAWTLFTNHGIASDKFLSTHPGGYRCGGRRCVQPSIPMRSVHTMGPALVCVF